MVRRGGPRGGGEGRADLVGCGLEGGGIEATVDASEALSGDKVPDAGDEALMAVVRRAFQKKAGGRRAPPRGAAKAAGNRDGERARFPTACRHRVRSVTSSTIRVACRFTCGSSGVRNSSRRVQ